MKLITIPMERSAASGLNRRNKVTLIKHLWVVLFLSVGFAHGTAHLQAKDTGGTFRKLQVCVAEAGKKFPDRKTTAGKLVGEITTDSNALLDKWMNTDNKELPDDYLKSIEVNCDLLAQAEDEKDNETLALLQDVSEDLDVKAKQAKKQVGAAEDLGASVVVTVKTRKNGKEVDGYLVRCNPKRYATQTPALFVFNNPTNQAERSLPPGNYVFWLETVNQEFVTSRPITVGGNGEKSQPTIWFDIP